MEVLYSKLYDKYTKLKVCSFINNRQRLLRFVSDSSFYLSLKSKKLSELDHLNKEQEVKFVNYLSAAEELIEHLKSEKEDLLGQVNELRTELASLRHVFKMQLSFRLLI
ncbi:hypothetical protein V8G54_019041 [Vigna mungo]|uniref:Uncharacterized protein n=1 Tax=Vigna mungo TaxID=3915 RepID=A0AAQ3NAY2_VIGMU